MAQQRVCSKCNSEKVIPLVPIYVPGEQPGAQPQLEVCEFPDALMFKGKHRSRTLARVCGACGFTELYAESYLELWAAYQAQLKAR